MREFLLRLASVFPGAAIVFDACSPLGCRVANKAVIKAGGMDDGAILRWGRRNPADIERWSRLLKIESAYPLFKGVKQGLPLKSRIGATLSDLLKIMFMVHIRFL